MRSHPAFTVVELIVAMLITTIFLGGMTKSLLGLRRNASVRGAVDQYVSLHSLARASAVRHGRTTRLRAESAVPRILVEVRSPDGASWQAVSGGATYFENGVRFSTTRTILCFDPRGLAIETETCESPDATVIFSHSGRSDTLRTTRVGRVMR